MFLPIVLSAHPVIRQCRTTVFVVCGGVRLVFLVAEYTSVWLTLLIWSARVPTMSEYSSGAFEFCSEEVNIRGWCLENAMFVNVHGFDIGLSSPNAMPKARN